MSKQSESTPVERQEPERRLSGGCVFPAEVVAIGERLHTQDNRITSHPVFAVQQKRRIWGMDPDYSGNVAWVNPGNDYQVADERRARALDRMWQRGEEREDWTRTAYMDDWEFVTACLTEAGCEEFIRVNGHNLHEPRIYAYSAWRNAEWQTMRAHFKALATPTDSAVKEPPHAD